MKQLLSYLFVSVFVFSVTTLKASDNPKRIKSGVYGCCSCMGGGNKIIELTLNQDQTFTYIDNSNPSKKLSLNGTWKTEGDKIYLNSSNGQKSFHRKWKYSAEGKCIRSRYKMNFRRICEPGPC